MKKISQILIIAASIGFLSTSVEVRPLFERIGDLIEGTVGAATDLALAPLEVPPGYYWYNYYWGPRYWPDPFYYPYFREYRVEQPVEIQGDSWDVTNNTKNDIYVGTFDGSIRGKIRPGKTARIPTDGTNKIVIGHQRGKAGVHDVQPGRITITENNAGELQIKQ